MSLYVPPHKRPRQLDDEVANLSINDEPKQPAQRGNPVSSPRPKSKPNNRQKRKNDEFRHRTSQKVQEEEKARRLAKYQLPDVYPNPVPVAVKSMPVPVPVSTRGIGLAVSIIFETLNSAVQMTISVYQLYRATLLQFQLQVTRSYHRINNSEYTDTSRIGNLLPVEQETLVATYNNTFKLLSLIINSFGNFTYENKQFQPYIYSDYPSTPSGITIRNLRNVVVFLADEGSDQQVREQFHSLNCIPGSEWHHDPGSGWTIINPDMIIPPDYGLIQMEQDLTALKGQINMISKRLPGMFSELTFSGEGLAVQLVSIENPVAAIPSQIYHPAEAGYGAKKRGARMVPAYEGREEWFERPPINAPTEGYMCSELLSANEMAAGFITRYGERIGEIDRMAIRSKYLAIQVSEGIWKHCANNLIPLGVRAKPD